MAAIATQVTEHGRRLDQQSNDITEIYRETTEIRREIKELRRETRLESREVHQEFRWVRGALLRVMAHLEIEPPGDEEE